MPEDAIANLSEREQRVREILFEEDNVNFHNLADVVDGVDGFGAFVAAQESQGLTTISAREFAGIQYFNAFFQAARDYDSLKTNHWFSAALVGATGGILKRADELFSQYADKYAHDVIRGNIQREKELTGGYD